MSWQHSTLLECIDKRIRNDIIVFVIPEFTNQGLLPPGVFFSTWDEISARFGFSDQRIRLLKGLKAALTALATAGCHQAYLDGSFVTAKESPGDFDACWEEAGVDATKLDPVFLSFDNQRLQQKLKYGGEMFPASAWADSSGSPFVRFFQIHKENGEPKGIIAIDLSRWQP